MNTVRVVTFEGCNTATKLVEELEELRNRQPFELDVTVVPSADRAAEMGLHGSPTIYINDVEYQKDKSGDAGFY